MNTRHIDTRSTVSPCRRPLAFARLGAWAPPCALGLAALSCGSDTVLVAPARPLLGDAQINLLARGSGGTSFRLRSAVLMLQGPSQTLFLDSEAEPARTEWRVQLPAGRYESFLQEGWRLERMEGPTEPVIASLLSPNPDQFEILAGQATELALRFRVGGDEVTTAPAGSLEIAVEVEEPPGAPHVCANDSECGAGQVCCIAGFLGNCFTLDAGASCPLPDLTVSADAALDSLRIDEESFPADSCALEEGCVAAAGLRRLLRFSTATPNIGAMDVVLGDPAQATGFEYAPCHGHYHFEGYARYELVDSSGGVVAEGHKQAFCMLDSAPVGLPGAAESPRYHCEFQGLSRGWSDTYGANLDCQWVDVTDVPDGDYLLRISVNPERILPESDYDNNVVEVPVTVADPTPIDPLVGCSDPAASGPLRECGWAVAAGFAEQSCTPGERLRVGCGCPDATCEGDPMLRVCEGSTPCNTRDSLALAENNCGACPRVSFVCPESGTFSVLAGASDQQPFGCDVVMGPVEP